MFSRPELAAVMFLSISIILSFPASIVCTPVPLVPAANPDVEPAFVPEPRRRGTLSLFWNCAATYGLCVWTAVHTDVLPFAGFKQRIFHSFIWLVAALTFPEFLLLVAIDQLRQAVSLRSYWQQKFPDTLGLAGAFFVVMGGYTIQPPGDVDATATNKTKYLITLTPAGFKNLIDTIDRKRHVSFHRASKGDVPIGNDASTKEDQNLKVLTQILGGNPFDSNQISDKSKKDKMSKVIVALQTLWFGIQCIERKLARMPITVLELQIVIQILYSIVMYGCWWSKPFDIQQPISISVDREIWEVLGGRVGTSVSSPESGSENPERGSGKSERGSREHREGGLGKSEVWSHRLMGTGQREPGSETTTQKASMQTELEVTKVSVDGSATLLATKSSVHDIPSSPVNVTSTFSCDICTMSIVVEPCNWSHNRLFCRVLTTLMLSSCVQGPRLCCLPQFIRDTTSSPLTFLCYLGYIGRAPILCAVNSALHIMPWSSYFPSSTEKLLWKISCIGVFSAMLLAGILCALFGAADHSFFVLWDIKLTEDEDTWAAFQRSISENLKKIEEYNFKAPRWTLIVATVSTALLILMYSAFFTYYIVEAFISLRSLRSGAYDVPSLAQILPHI